MRKKVPRRYIHQATAQRKAKKTTASATGAYKGSKRVISNGPPVKYVPWKMDPPRCRLQVSRTQGLRSSAMQETAIEFTPTTTRGNDQRRQLAMSMTT